MSRGETPRLMWVPCCGVSMPFRLGFAERTSWGSSGCLGGVYLGVVVRGMLAPSWSNSSRRYYSSRWFVELLWFDRLDLGYGDVDLPCRLDSAFRSRIWWCFSASTKYDMSFECFLNFIFMYCCERMAVAGGNVERIFSISSASVMTWPHNRSWTVIRCSSELNTTKFGKSNTRMLAQSAHACDRYNVYWWSNWAWSCAHSSSGSSIYKYWSRNAWSRWWRNTISVCHLAAGGIGGVSSVGGMVCGVKVLARSSAFNNTLASLTHSRKLDPSEFNGPNTSACILNSVKWAFVDIDVLVCVCHPLMR